MVINETAARRFFGSAERALGGVAQLNGALGEQRAEVVGVVGDVRHTSIGVVPAPEVYRPFAQTFVTAMTLVVRTAGNPAASGAAVRAAVWSVDPDVAIAGMAPMTTAVRENLGRPRMIATLLLLFAAIGLTIVVCGVYGVVGYTVGAASGRSASGSPWARRSARFGRSSWGRGSATCSQVSRSACRRPWP